MGTKNIIGELTINGSKVITESTLPADNFSGSYNDLTDKPTIPTRVSDLENDEGYLTTYTETDPTVPAWAKEGTKPSYNLGEVSDTASYVRMTPGERTKLSSIASGAAVNVQSDWKQETTTADDYIKNKPSLGSLASKSVVSKTDLETSVQTSLDKADTALQSFTEVDPTVPSHVKAITEDDVENWGAAYTHSTNAHARTDATKVESSTNGNIKINGTDTTVYSHPNSGATEGTYRSVTVNAQGHVTAGSNPTTLAGYGIADAIPSSQKGSVDGVATLDSNGKVPTSQLPSYVDDVLEYDAKSSFPTAGETGKIYVDTTTNKTYRWGGSAYVEISASLALGETSSTAYAGDKGKIAYEHSQSVHAPSNAEKNQNAFSNVVVGSTTIVADTATDSLTLVGSNVTLTPDATNDIVTIGITKANVTDALGYTPPETDTKYTHPSYTEKSNGLYKVTVDATGHVSEAIKVVKSDITALGIPTTDTGATSVEVTGSGNAVTSASYDPDTRKITLTKDATYNNYSLPAAGASLGGVKSGGDVTITDGVITVNDDSHNHIIGNVDGLQDALDARLEKTTYETSKELACGSNGKVCLGKFSAYDTNITIEINSTTDSTYHATIIIQSQNIAANSTNGTVTCRVYGDADDHVTDLLTIFRPYGSADRFIEVYANLPGWSKNLIHVQAVNLQSGGMTDVLTSVSSIPTSITGKTRVWAHNVLWSNFIPNSITDIYTAYEQNVSEVAAGEGGISWESDFMVLDERDGGAGETSYGNLNQLVPIVAGDNVEFTVEESESGYEVVKISASGGGSNITVDSALSSTSTNPVQNKVVYAALNGYIDTYNEGVTSATVNTNGLVWTDKFAVEDSEGESVGYGDISHRVPLVAGNNINFSVIEQSGEKRFEISAAGGKVYVHNVMISTTAGDIYTCLYMQIVNSSSTAINSITALRNALQGRGAVTASGRYRLGAYEDDEGNYYDAEFFVIVGIDSNYIHGVKMNLDDEYTLYEGLSYPSSANVTDKVVTL